MAKSLRASGKKHNKTKLRSRVFAPVEDARSERLSAKLLTLAAEPKPQMEASEPAKSEEDTDKQASAANSELMDVDTKRNPVKKKKETKRVGKSYRAQRKQAKAAVVFPVGRKHRI